MALGRGLDTFLLRYRGSVAESVDISSELRATSCVLCRPRGLSTGERDAETAGPTRGRCRRHKMRYKEITTAGHAVGRVRGISGKLCEVQPL